MDEWGEIFRRAGLQVMTRRQIVDLGAAWREIERAIGRRSLIRLRQDRYCLPTIEPHLAEAIRLGGRLGCVSALREYSVFAFDTRSTHVHLEPHAHPRQSRKSGTELHWWPLLDRHDGDEYRVGLIDALAQALRCQKRWHAVASIDNALFLRRIDEADIGEIFVKASKQNRTIRELIDGRSESGLESVLRMIVREAGLAFEIQQTIPGVGRVDMVIEGCLVIEADSRGFHEGWEAQERDRRRDLVAAKQGYMTLRPSYRHIMFEPELVLRSIVELLERGRTSEKLSISPRNRRKMPVPKNFSDVLHG